jgi:hypothetical protein
MVLTASAGEQQPKAFLKNYLPLPSQAGGSFTDINHLPPTNFNSQAVGINSDSTPWIVGFYQPDSLLVVQIKRLVPDRRCLKKGR